MKGTPISPGCSNPGYSFYQFKRDDPILRYYAICTADTCTGIPRQIDYSDLCHVYHRLRAAQAAACPLLPCAPLPAAPSP